MAVSSRTKSRDLRKHYILITVIKRDRQTDRQTVGRTDTHCQ